MIGKRSRAARLRIGSLYLAAIALAAVVIIPIVYVVLGGFRTTGQIAAKPDALPNPWVTHNYAHISVSGTFWREVGNSIIVASIATVLVVVVSRSPRTRSPGWSSAGARSCTRSSPSACSSRSPSPRSRSTSCSATCTCARRCSASRCPRRRSASRSR